MSRGWVQMPRNKVFATSYLCSVLLCLILSPKATLDFLQFPLLTVKAIPILGLSTCSFHSPDSRVISHSTFNQPSDGRSHASFGCQLKCCLLREDHLSYHSPPMRLRLLTQLSLARYCPSSFLSLSLDYKLHEGRNLGFPKVAGAAGVPALLLCPGPVLHSRFDSSCEHLHFFA